LARVVLAELLPIQAVMVSLLYLIPYLLPVVAVEVEGHWLVELVAVVVVLLRQVKTIIMVVLQQVLKEVLEEMLPIMVAAVVEAKEVQVQSEELTLQAVQDTMPRLSAFQTQQQTNDILQAETTLH